VATTDTSEVYAVRIISTMGHLVVIFAVVRFYNDEHQNRVYDDWWAGVAIGEAADTLEGIVLRGRAWAQKIEEVEARFYVPELGNVPYRR